MITLVPDMSQDQQGLRLYPNPVRESATFEIPVDNPGLIRITINDSHGAIVSIVQTYASMTGIEKISWNAKDASGADLVPGLYTFHVLSGEHGFTGKFVLH
jgi:flagellar hook assembly protein FlgD